MHALIRKARADLTGRLWQSILIGLSVGAAATLLYLGIASLSAASAPYERQMERANGAHAWFYLRGSEAAERIVSRPEVTESTRRPVLYTYLVAPEVEKVPWIDLMPLPSGERPLMGYILLEGRSLGPDDRGDALVAVSLARFLHAEVGDTVRVQTKEGPRPLRIAGLITDPKSCTFPRCDGVSVFVLPGTFAELTPAGSDLLTLVGVRLAEPEGADGFMSRVRRAESALVKGAATWQQRQDFYRGDRLFNVVPVLLLGLSAVIAAALILAMIVGGAVLSQYREIAVLKSLGFTAAQVLMLYAGQAVILALLGGGIGVLGGHLLSVRTMAPLARSMGTPDILGFMPGVAALVLLLVVVVAGGCAALAAWRAVAVRPAALLVDGFGAPQGKTPLAARFLALLRAPLPLVLGVKDAMARPARAAMTLLSLIVCLLTVTVGFNGPNIGAQLNQHKELIGVNWDMVVQPGELSAAEAEAAVRKLPQLEGLFRESFAWASAVDHEFDVGLRAVSGDWNRFGFLLLSGRLPEAPGEILLAPRVWDRLGVKEGQELMLQIGDRTLPVTVVGKYQDAMNNGRDALTPLATLERFGSRYTEKPVLRVKLQAAADWVAARRELLEQTGYRPLVTLEDRELPDFAREVIAMMQLLAWVMAAIASLSVVGAALLTAREQAREVAIRKALGMTPAQVIGSVTAGGLWYGLIAAVVALPLALLLQKGLVAAMAGVMGLEGMAIALPGSILLFAGGLGIGLAALAALPAAVWGARVVTASALHAE